ncbi:UDP-N-acetylmuramoyl-tripeptide--D-alanyl-D-alanine ligase [Cytophaga sp. FL35]|uniref:UDP-N-acetylmuramoyl-tripeptide--D-alanyl-D- alanine ligase n=1 Tax=Cytophaga sp. FL35 TaxID=1904456 RepID=UPI001653A3F2|nr:UDP-N-acetylmuramoyl-tripeptide--D-alanyl-D-alanine ligase [Cytophaga sp. FL35]MBC6998499.1 UDP-N-acetylmuramoyl-tripeptide--D-alanyl-D-alanine ligase [Cytophaga sp. FL35]
MEIQQIHEQFLANPIVCTDTRKITKGCIFFALKGINFNGNKYASQALEKGACLAIVDEQEFAISNQYILVADVLKTLQELAQYHRKQSKAQIIGLTGSNGKTTTKELIHSVISKKYKTIATKGNLNNHIGVPLTLLSIKEDTEMAIIEMGANHQKEIEFLCSIAQPDFGYITNFGKAHLEGFGGVEGIIKGKSELYQYLTENKKSVFLNADDPIQLNKLESYIKKYGFSTQNKDYYIIDFLGASPFVRLQLENLKIQTNLIGSYNFTNCAAAALIGKYFNVLPEKIKEALEEYIPNNNRSQILEKGDRQIILDAYNANPTSMKAALENFQQMAGDTKIVFLGDMFELGESAKKEHQEIADLVKEMNFQQSFLVGENFATTNTNIHQFRTFDSLSENWPTLKLAENCLILIKGSRGMALERILDLL